MEVKFPIVAGSIVLVAIALAVRSHFERMKLTEIRAFELGRQSASTSTQSEPTRTEVLSSANFASYIAGGGNARA
jgi:hypothetical protein